MLRYIEHFLWIKVLVQWYQDLWMLLGVWLDNQSLKAKEYLGFKVLEGEEGNSFYGSRLGSSFRCLVEVWFRGQGCGSLSIKTTAKAKGLVVLRSCKEKKVELRDAAIN